jgi:hypothetical protein
MARNPNINMAKNIIARGGSTAAKSRANTQVDVR